MSDKNIVLYVHETVLQSWLSDAGTFITFVGIIGTGWFLESEAMQWAGFLVTAVVLFFRAASKKLEVHRVTPQEAADLLHQKFSVIAARETHDV